MGRRMIDVRRPQERVSRASIAVAAFSTIVEWYDFTLYLYLATVISRVFFGGGETALITSWDFPLEASTTRLLRTCWKARLAIGAA